MPNQANTLYLNAEEFADIEDGGEIEVTVRGTKQMMDGAPYLQVMEIDGVPVYAPEEMEPGQEAVNRAQDAGYLRGSDRIE